MNGEDTELTIAEIIEKLRQERNINSRFPSRIIFVEDLSSYHALVKQLKNVCDVTVNIADFGTKDVVPQFDKMRDALKEYGNKQILLLSVGEYLRMCIKRELNKDRAQFPAFWEIMQQESSKCRYIMPIFCCGDSFERIIGRVNERQENFLWFLDSDREQKKYSISVYSPIFSDTINADAYDLESWLRNWDSILDRKNNCAVLTNQYRNVEESFGIVNIHKIDNTFTYLMNLLKDSDRIDRTWETDDFWSSIIPYAEKGMCFSDVVLKQLNIKIFDFVSVISRWNTLNNMQKELVWLWYRIYPTDEYYSYACKKAHKSEEIPICIRDEILLLLSRSQDWISERMRAMQALNFSEYDDSYFALIDKLPLPEMKLQLLTYKTHEECRYAIKVISDILRNGAELEEVKDLLKDMYPVLSVYMCKKSEIDDEIDEYFSWYKKNKLINRFPEKYPKHISYDRFDSRLKQLNKLNDKDHMVFWIDGLGIEWLPVLLYELNIRGMVPETSVITKAKLPTETKYNHQWDTEDSIYVKWDRLDSYSHKGKPDDKSYFSCIVHQLSVFKEVAKEVEKLLENHEYVAITGDHGSSRLAALAFHDTSILPIMPPKKAKVCSFGRFCILSDDEKAFLELDNMKRIDSDGKTYIIMTDYNHFSVGGNAAGGNSDEQDVVGEIHGGDTPEERLVPVVILKSSKPLPPLVCKTKDSFVVRKNGCIQITLEFNRQVYSLEVTYGTIKGICRKKTDNIWNVDFGKISYDELSLTIVANGNLLKDKINVKVKKGIGTNNNMGGLP